MSHRSRGGRATAGPGNLGENLSLVFLSGFLAALAMSAFSFYSYRYIGVYSFIGLIGLVLVDVVSVYIMYSNKFVYLLGVGLGIIAGYFGSSVVKWMFDFLTWVGINVSRVIVFAVSPKDYAATALLIGLIGATLYALVYAMHSITTSIFVSGVLSLYRYPDILLFLGIVVMYPFYVIYIYTFVYSFLIIVLTAVVAAFWFAKLATAMMAVVAVVELMLFVFTGSWLLPRLFTNAASVLGSSILDFYGVYYEPAELDRTMRNQMYMFLVYALIAAFSGLVAAYYRYYTALYMITMVVAALGTWGTFVVTPLSLSKTGLSWRVVRRVIQMGLFAIAMVVTALMIGYTHSVDVVSTCINDFTKYYTSAVWKLIHDIFYWLFA